MAAATTSKLEALPPGLFGAIYSSVTAYANCLTLSSASRALREGLVLELFRTVKVSSDPGAQCQGGLHDDDDTVVLSELVKDSVRTIRFADSKEGLPRQKNWTDPALLVLPETCRRVLTGEVSPRARAIHVRLDFAGFGRRHHDACRPRHRSCQTGTEPWDHECSLGMGGLIESIFVYGKPEKSEDVVRDKENRYPWHALMRDV